MRSLLWCAGAGAAVITGVGALAMGWVGDSEARVLLEAMLPTSRFLCSAVMTASATILALMLTLLGFSVNSDMRLSDTFYLRVKHIAFYDMLLLIVAISFLVLHCIPITKSDQLPEWWYPTLYYGLLGAAAVIGGAMVSVVVMLYSAVKDVIHAFGLEDKDRSIIAEDASTQSS